MESYSRHEDSHRIRRWALGALSFLLGLSPVLFLVYSFVEGAPYYWGNPTSWKDFFNLLTGGPFQNQVLGFGTDMGTQIERIAFGIGELSSQYTPLGIARVWLGWGSYGEQTGRSGTAHADGGRQLCLRDELLTRRVSLFIPTISCGEYLCRWRPAGSCTFTNDGQWTKGTGKDDKSAIGYRLSAIMDCDDPLSSVNDPANNHRSSVLRRRWSFVGRRSSVVVPVGACVSVAIALAVAVPLSLHRPERPERRRRDHTLALLSAAPQGATLYLDWEALSPVRLLPLRVPMRRDLTLHSGDPSGTGRGRLTAISRTAQHLSWAPSLEPLRLTFSRTSLLPPPP